MPAAAHTEKDGSFTNTQRLLQWHHKAVEPLGDCRSELWFYYHLGRIIREKLADSEDAARPAGARSAVALPDRGRDRRAERRGGAARDQRHAAPDGAALSAYTELAGRRLDGLRLLDLLRLLRRRGEPAGPAQARLRADLGGARSGAGRGRPTAASSTTAPRPTPTGRPWSERKRYVWWDEERGPVDGRRRAGLPAPTSGRTTCPPRRRQGRAGASRGNAPVHHAGRRPRLAVRAGRAGGWAAADPLRAARVAVLATRCTAQRSNPARQVFERPGNRSNPSNGDAGRRPVPIRDDHATG